MKVAQWHALHISGPDAPQYVLRAVGRTDEQMARVGQPKRCRDVAIERRRELHIRS